MKSECMMLRTKLKEVENDYRTLQTKHRLVGHEVLKRRTSLVH